MTAIDISRYQGVIDFTAVKAAGVQLVIAKQGGADSGLYTDSKYLANRDGIRAAGLPLGSYFFNGPAASPIAAADYLWAGMDYRPGDLAVIDVEGSGLAWSPAQVLAFVEQMIAHGIPAAAVGVYMSASPERTQDWSAVAATGCFLWIASYGSNSGTPGTPPASRWWPSWSLWQYTSNGSVPGIAGRVDTSQLASGWAPFIITPTRKKHIMPTNIVKASTLDSKGQNVPGKTLWGTFGEPACPVQVYTRTATVDPGPALGASYGPHTPVSDGTWDWFNTEYSKVPAVGQVTVAPDPVVVDLLTQLLATAKAPTTTTATTAPKA